MIKMILKVLKHISLLVFFCCLGVVVSVLCGNYKGGLSAGLGLYLFWLLVTRDKTTSEDEKQRSEAVLPPVPTCPSLKGGHND